MSVLAGAVKAGAISFRASCRDRGRWIVLGTWRPSTQSEAPIRKSIHMRALT
jgi:hypothetical protein